MLINGDFAAIVIVSEEELQFTWLATDRTGGGRNIGRIMPGLDCS